MTVSMSSMPSAVPTPRSNRPRFTLAITTTQLLVAMLFVLMFALATRVPADTDTWWHLRSGQLILNTHAVPYTDPFSLTKAGQPWIDQSWLAQIVMWLMYQIAGNAGLALFVSILATIGMAFTYAASPGNRYLRAFLLILSASTAAVFWSARPQMFSFALSGAVLWIIYTWKRGEADRLWALPFIMALWVNLHSGFAIGLIFLGCAIGGELFNRQPWPRTRKLILVTAVSVAALLINPYTVQMLIYPFQTAGIGALEQYIQEWSSPNFHARETWPLLIMLFGTLAAVGFSKRGWDWTDLALTSVTAVLALVWERNFAVFAVAAVPTLCLHLQTIISRLVPASESSLPTQRRPSMLNTGILLVIIVAALFKVALVIAPGEIGQVQQEALPVRAAAWLNQNNPPGPMFNSYNWGGYLMFAAPQYPVFVDGRTDLYGSAVLDQWRVAYSGGDWQPLFQQWGIRLVVIEQDNLLAAILRHDPNWQEAYTDKQASIFIKKPQS